MESSNWENPISSTSRRNHCRNPSFSSTLLDQIYRSIDDDYSPPVESTMMITTKKIHHHQHRHAYQDHPPEKLVFHRRSIAADFERSSTRKTNNTDSVFLPYSNNNSACSSDSTGGFSSSESVSSPPPTTRQPKPIRTTSVERFDQKPNTSKQELGGFLRTKSKALKIYTDLKKVKHPISPGGRLAAFLNSLFTNAASSNPRKPKKTSEPAVSSSSTTCSSASSFSRSCLSKTPSSSGKSKRSVRFCPVNVILDEDSSSIHHIPYGYNNERHVMEEENRRVIEAAKDLIRTYQKMKNKDHLAMHADDVTNVDDVEEDDDDAASYASSDLFELENLSAIGIERYQEELPVYETTRLDNTNRPISTALLV
ncbi:hypothetical protein EUTSA_v10022002mg [Eutrema salsugineum]|uniref:Protein BIG GRAIN 1-like A n=1 Tax=Eutrema salsugineum TaxID=72664 RepID=V4LDS8_EUTSA|nr:protein BIG GRAIN 1-like A [Eutrema salsugineum]ESQ48595.1 hypothetical protein EUTSA_v10022002mg [Eutrema salsugineum]